MKAFTTSRTTLGGYLWLDYRSDKSTAQGLYVFTDGSSSGAFAAVVVADGEQVHGVRHAVACTGTHNVGAELNGLGLGLSLLRPESTVTIVHDYLGLSAWCVGAWKIGHPEVREKIDSILHLITAAKLDVTFCHHRGHQTDNSDFTKWNNTADRLCSGKQQMTARVILPRLELAS